MIHFVTLTNQRYESWSISIHMILAIKIRWIFYINFWFILLKCKKMEDFLPWRVYLTLLKWCWKPIWIFILIDLLVSEVVIGLVGCNRNSGEVFFREEACKVGFADEFLNDCVIARLNEKDFPRLQMKVSSNIS
mgnify:CR=1 FL=1